MFIDSTGTFKSWLICQFKNDRSLNIKMNKNIIKKEITIMKKYKIEVDCANCAAKIEDAVKKLPGVNSASVSFMAQKMVLDVDDDKFDAVLKDVVKTAKRVEPDFEIEL